MKGRLVATVILREWRTRVLKRSFIIGTLLMPFLSIGLWPALCCSARAATPVTPYWWRMLQASSAIGCSSGQYVPRCPGCFPERPNLEYRFVREAPSDSAWRPTGTVLVEYDEAVLQNKSGYLVYETSPADGQTRHRA